MICLDYVERKLFGDRSLDRIPLLAAGQREYRTCAALPDISQFVNVRARAFPSRVFNLACAPWRGFLCDGGEH